MDICVLPNQASWREKYRRLFSEGRLFLAEAPEMKKKLIAAGAPPERTAIQRIAIPVGTYPSWNPNLIDLSVLFVGRFVEKKGLIDAIRAVGRARRTFPRLTMRIVGDGPELALARAAVRDEQLESAVTFLGMQPHKRVIEELRGTNVLVHPSRVAEDGDSEGGAPTILLEAQAIGTPIVSTMHADIPNVVGPGPSVRLCAEGDVESIAAALVEILKNPGRVDAGFVRAHHDVATEIHGLEAKYHRAMDLAVAV
jgi:glycosyltransferase involved in cell wall biosynthesis